MSDQVVLESKNVTKRFGGLVAVGDTIITSGLGGYFVEGLIIGTVSKIEVPEKEFFYDITVNPAVNFNGLDELFILVPLKEGEQ